jgi:hypothetical protein
MNDGISDRKAKYLWKQKNQSQGCTSSWDHYLLLFFRWPVRHSLGGRGGIFGILGFWDFGILMLLLTKYRDFPTIHK